MKLIRRATFGEALGYWFNREYETRTDFRRSVDQRVGSRVNALRRGSDSSAVADRRAIMMAWRGAVIQGLETADWTLSIYGEDDLSSLQIIDSGDWREIGSGSLDPLNIASRIESDVALRTGKYANQITYILNQLAMLATGPSRIIFTGTSAGPFTVIDGVHRLVAECLYYKIRNKDITPDKEAYVGITQIPYARRFG